MSVDEWRQRVRMLPGLLSELEVTKRREDVVSSRRSRASGQSPLVFRLGAAEVMSEIEALLRSVLVTYGLENGRGVVLDSLPRMLVRVSEHASWVDKHKRSGEWSSRLDELIARGWSVVDTPPDRIRLGVCGAPIAEGEDCPGELWREPDQVVVQCPLCGAVCDVRERMDVALKRASAFRAPLSVVVQVLRSSGVKITHEQARKWTTRTDAHGRRLLSHVAVRSDGTKLYAVGDVIASLGARKRDVS